MFAIPLSYSLNPYSANLENMVSS